MNYKRVISRLLNALIFFCCLYSDIVPRISLSLSLREIPLEILQIFEDGKMVKREVGIRSWKSECREIAVQAQST